MVRGCALSSDAMPFSCLFVFAMSLRWHAILECMGEAALLSLTRGARSRAGCVEGSCGREFAARAAGATSEMTTSVCAAAAACA